MPSSFLPPDDRGVLMMPIELRVGAMRARTIEGLNQVKQFYLTQKQDSVQPVFATQGFSFGGQGQNLAMLSCG